MKIYPNKIPQTPMWVAPNAWPQPIPYDVYPGVVTTTTTAEPLDIINKYQARKYATNPCGEIPLSGYINSR